MLVALRIIGVNKTDKVSVLTEGRDNQNLVEKPDNKKIRSIKCQVLKLPCKNQAS